MRFFCAGAAVQNAKDFDNLYMVHERARARERPHTCVIRPTWRGGTLLLCWCGAVFTHRSADVRLIYCVCVCAALLLMLVAMCARVKSYQGPRSHMHRQMRAHTHTQASSIMRALLCAHAKFSPFASSLWLGAKSHPHCESFPHTERFSRERCAQTRRSTCVCVFAVHRTGADRHIMLGVRSHSLPRIGEQRA